MVFKTVRDVLRPNKKISDDSSRQGTAGWNGQRCPDKKEPPPEGGGRRPNSQAAIRLVISIGCLLRDGLNSTTLMHS